MGTLALSRSLMGKLREAGFDEKQARALAESQTEFCAAYASEYRRKIAAESRLQIASAEIPAKPQFGISLILLVLVVGIDVGACLFTIFLFLQS